jgi:hypothetical protein
MGAMMHYQKIKSTKDACETLEQNPPIENMSFYIRVCDQEALILFSFNISDSDSDLRIEIEIFDHKFDVDVWTRLGRVSRTCNLHQSQLYRSIPTRDADVIDDERLASTARCIFAFFAEVKHNKSIVDADLDLTVGATISDLSELIQNNKALKDLRLESEEPVSLEQSTVLSRAIANDNWKCLIIKVACLKMMGHLIRCWRDARMWRSY